MNGDPNYPPDLTPRLARQADALGYSRRFDPPRLFTDKLLAFRKAMSQGGFSEGETASVERSVLKGSRIA